MKNLIGKTLAELNALAAEAGFPGYTGEQLAGWLYKKKVTRLEEMTNLSKKTRSILAENYTTGISPFRKESISSDGTKKYLFNTANGHFIETAYIPENKRHTLCVSSQVGCKMGCLFCMTGKQGFQGNLTPDEILNQVLAVPEQQLLTNIVFMGMGEPLDNLVPVLKTIEILTADWGLGMSPRRITLSTIGLLPALKTFLDQSDCHLAISLHSPFDEERKTLIPVQAVHPIKDVVQLLKSYNWRGQRRLSFEYILFKGLNDSPKHISELAGLLHGIKCRVNLIRFHKIPETPWVPLPDKEIVFFRDQLTKRGIYTTIRQSRGEDIDAACGLLSTRERVTTGSSPT